MGDGWWVMGGGGEKAVGGSIRQRSPRLFLHQSTTIRNTTNTRARLEYFSQTITKWKMCVLLTHLSHLHINTNLNAIHLIVVTWKLDENSFLLRCIGYLNQCVFVTTLTRIPIGILSQNLFPSTHLQVVLWFISNYHSLAEMERRIPSFVCLLASCLVCFGLGFFNWSRYNLFFLSWQATGVCQN